MILTGQERRQNELYLSELWVCNFPIEPWVTRICFTSQVWRWAYLTDIYVLICPITELYSSLIQNCFISYTCPKFKFNIPVPQAIEKQRKAIDFFFCLTLLLLISLPKLIFLWVENVTYSLFMCLLGGGFPSVAYT
jgi:hypothetical protein